MNAGRPRRERVLEVVLLASSVLVAVMLAEGVLRAFHFSKRLERPLYGVYPWIIDDPFVGFANQPGHVNERLGFRINSLGFRGPEVERRRRPGTVRVVCLGDSTTFGVWRDAPIRLRGYTAYPQELATLLAEDGHFHVEVINAGVMGSMTAHGLRMLLSRVLALRPDVLTIRYGNNEHAPGSDASGWEWTPIARLPPGAYDWEVVRLGFHGVGRMFPLAPPEWRPRKLTVDQFRRDLHRFVEICREHGIKLLLLDFPLRPLERRVSPGAAFPNGFAATHSLKELHEWHAEYAAAVRGVAAETATPLLDTAEQFRESPTPLFTDYDHCHPNQAGAELLGRLLRDELGALHWLEATPMH